MSCVIRTLQQNAGRDCAFQEPLSWQMRGPGLQRAVGLQQRRAASRWAVVWVNKGLYDWSKTCCKKLYTIHDPNPLDRCATASL